MIAIRRLTRVTYPFIIHVTPQSNLFTLVRSQDARFTECIYMNSSVLIPTELLQLAIFAN